MTTPSANEQPTPLYFPSGERAYHCDKQGNPISTEDWAKLDGDRAYKFHLVTQLAGDTARVVTIYNGLDIYGAGPVPSDELKAGRSAYRDELFEEQIHLSEPAALAGHLELVKKLVAWLASGK